MTETDGINWTARLGRLALLGGVALSLLSAFIVFDRVPYGPETEVETLGCYELIPELYDVYLRWQEWKWTWKSRFRKYLGYVQLLRRNPDLPQCDFWLPFVQRVKYDNLHLYRLWGA